MTERTETRGSDGTPESAAASEAAESESETSESERECPACGDTFEDGAAYRDHLFSVGLVY